VAVYESYESRRAAILDAMKRLGPSATVEDIANDIACSRQNACRVLRRMEDEGLVEHTGYGQQRRLTGTILKAPEVTA
jgi:Mn-dependent DtxR family transcriptional regulator